MKSIFNRLFENHSLIYKIVLYIFSVIAIVYLFPKEGQFKYQFQKGKIWQYEDFNAPFDFAIKKTKEELNKEQESIIQDKIFFFNFNDSINRKTRINYDIGFKNLMQTSNISKKEKKNLFLAAKLFLKNEYKKGYMSPDTSIHVKPDEIIALKKGNEVVQMPINTFLTKANIDEKIDNFFLNQPHSIYKTKTIALLKETLKYNVSFDVEFTDKVLKEKLDKVVPNKGFVPKKTPIISKGEIVEGEKFSQLQSIAKEFESKTWSKSNYIWLLAAYTLLIGLALLMLMLFIEKYRPNVYQNSSKITFIFVNVFLVILITTLLIRFNVKYLYVIPFAILPLIIKAFFDARLGLITYVLTILLLGFIVPNSFEFIFIQLVAGIVTILTTSELGQRANLFITVAKITGIYLLSYLAFSITQEGNIVSIDWLNIGLFTLNGMITVSVLIPIIFLFEKIFGLVSDESLREFSDSNNKLLKDLNEKAPGTFQHSMQVANLAESAAKEIGANFLLVRAGALYHDIGKIYNPMYFTENQSTSVNPHNELSPEDSAQIIINHIIKGIELAKKNKLPDRLIDFIRTHHGTNLVYYFYKKEEELNPDSIIADNFRYPGPIPFSKETAILMICDAAEAATKSIKEPTAIAIDNLINKIVKGQMDNGQFQNADITFKEIEKVKKVVKKKLNSIYHVRIEYPE